MDRNELLDGLKGLLASQFDVLLARLKVHGLTQDLLDGAQATQATQIIKFFEQRNRSLSTLEAELTFVVSNQTTSQVQPNEKDFSTTETNGGKQPQSPFEPASSDHKDSNPKDVEHHKHTSPKKTKLILAAATFLALSVGVGLFLHHTFKDSHATQAIKSYKDIMQSYNQNNFSNLNFLVEDKIECYYNQSNLDRLAYIEIMKQAKTQKKIMEITMASKPEVIFSSSSKVHFVYEGRDRYAETGWEISKKRVIMSHNQEHGWRLSVEIGKKTKKPCEGWSRPPLDSDKPGCTITRLPHVAIKP